MNYFTLTMETFWKNMEENYLYAMKLFKTWIDEYKKENQWDTLFNVNTSCSGKCNSPSPKYHDLPAAMQYGIFQQFASIYSQENNIELKQNLIFTIDGISVYIESFFRIADMSEIKKGQNCILECLEQNY